MENLLFSLQRKLSIIIHLTGVIRWSAAIREPPKISAQRRARKRGRGYMQSPMPQRKSRHGVPHCCDTTKVLTYEKKHSYFHFHRRKGRSRRVQMVFDCPYTVLGKAVAAQHYFSTGGLDLDSLTVLTDQERRGPNSNRGNRRN